jgi:hypothetical protein
LFCPSYPCSIGATVTLGNIQSGYYIKNFSINWGDTIAGYTYTPNLIGFTNTYSVTHTYNKSGTFTINGVLFDTFGNIYSLGPVTITILNRSVSSTGQTSGSTSGLGTINSMSLLLSQSLGIPTTLSIQFIGIIIFALFAIIGLYFSSEFHISANLSTSIMMIIGAMIDLVLLGNATAWILVIAILIAGVEFIQAFLHSGITIIGDEHGTEQ